VVSGREGLIKPDPAIFEILRERFGLDPVRTVFVDDLPANVEAARSPGFLGLVFTDVPRPRGDLLGLCLLGVWSTCMREASYRLRPDASPSGFEVVLHRHQGPVDVQALEVREAVSPRDDAVEDPRGPIRPLPAVVGPGLGHSRRRAEIFE